MVRAAGRAIVALLGLVVGGAVVVLLREATMSTHQPLPADSRVAVVVDVATRKRERDQSQAEMVDRVGQYVAAGADQVNIAMRAPWDVASLDHLAGAIDELGR